MDHYKRIKDLFDLVWSEERVEHILNKDWKKLKSNTKDLDADISFAFDSLESLPSLEAKREYVETLSEELKESMLVVLTRKINMFKKKVEFLDTQSSCEEMGKYQVNGRYIIH